MSRTIVPGAMLRSSDLLENPDGMDEVHGSKNILVTGVGLDSARSNQLKLFITYRSLGCRILGIKPDRFSSREGGSGHRRGLLPNGLPRKPTTPQGAPPVHTDQVCMEQL